MFPKRKRSLILLFLSSLLFITILRAIEVSNAMRLEISNVAFKSELEIENERKTRQALKREKAAHAIYFGMKAAFNHIWRNDQWKDTYPHGDIANDLLLENMKFHARYSMFLWRNRIRSVTEAGCGPWPFNNLVAYGNIRYTCVDVSDFVIKRNQEQFGNLKRNFMHGSLTEPLPAADILVVNNVLQHLTNDRIIKFIVTNILPANETAKCLFKYALITNDQCAVVDAGADYVGGYSAIDLSKGPFELPVVTFYKYNLTDYCKVAQLLEFKKLGCKQYVIDDR